MAITKIHPIKTTLKHAFDYIMDEDKTDEQILITSYGCGHETAYIEFQKTKDSWNSTARNLARHLIQSFDPNDNVTPEIAHKIGIKLANETLKNKYEYVITTHIDKGHIHNHILLNNVSFVDGKAYISNKKTYHKIRQISDKLCQEYSLSVIDKDSKEKGKSYIEYQENKRGFSWKSQLKYAIDSSIRQSNDWDHFLSIMKNFGYEIKEGKHISFCAKDQQRFTRAKTIGDYYTEEKIKERIVSSQKYLNKGDINRSVDKIINMNTNKKVKNFKGYEMWAKQHNLKNISKTLLIMNKYGIKNVEELNSSIKEEHLLLAEKSQDIKTIENQISELNTNIKNIDTFKKYHSLYNSYQNSNDKAQFHHAHSDKIILYEAASEYLSSDFDFEKTNNTQHLEEQILELKNRKDLLLDDYQTQKNKVSELNLLQSNLETYIRLNKLNQKYINER